MVDQFPTMRDLAQANPAAFITGKKTTFRGIGPATLEKFADRARLLADPNGKPYLRQPVRLGIADRELFFDIEVDPMRDVCYLHGFVERTGGDNATERFVTFFAADVTPAAEEQAFSDAWAFMRAAQPAADPVMPSTLENRDADNWTLRALFASES